MQFLIVYRFIETKKLFRSITSIISHYIIHITCYILKTEFHVSEGYILKVFSEPIPSLHYVVYDSIAIYII